MTKSSRLILYYVSYGLLCSIKAGINLEDYQDIVVNGNVISAGRRDCADRYESIKKVLNLYKRPFTIIDIGAAEGYFSFRAAYDYPATCIMIESDKRRRLLDLCKQNDALDTIMLLEKQTTVADFRELGSCEHFDVVLALNVVHWFGKHWKEATDALLTLGDNILIETPPAGDTTCGAPYLGFINDYLRKDCCGEIIGEFQRHTSEKKSKLYWIKSSKKSLEKVQWKQSQKWPSTWTIHSSFSEKYIDKGDSRTQWTHGIGFITFSALRGVYPDHKTIKMLLRT